MCPLIRIGSKVLAILAAIVLVAGPVAAASVKDAELGDAEIKLGSEAAAQVAKDYKLGDNAADLKRIRQIGEKIAAVANKEEVKAVYGSPKVTPFQYDFNLIEDDDVNAFSVPAGHVYVYRGLLDFVQSDQELAAVIAHEITHAAHHHMVYLLKKQAALNNEMAIALLATMLSGARSSDVGNVLLGAQLYQIARLTGYGMQAERDADYGAVIYMRDAGYNPVGLLTFLERLARRPELIDYGIYRSHPLDAERVGAAKTLIEQLGLPINRRQTTRAVKAEVRLVKVAGVDGAEVVINDKTIYRAAPADGKTSQERANEVADKINQMLDADLKMHEIKVDPAGGVIARDQALIVISDADAKLMGLTPVQVANVAVTAIREVVWKQMIDTMH